MRAKLLSGGGLLCGALLFLAYALVASRLPVVALEQDLDARQRLLQAERLLAERVDVPDRDALLAAVRAYTCGLR